MNQELKVILTMQDLDTLSFACGYLKGFLSQKEKHLTQDEQVAITGMYFGLMATRERILEQLEKKGGKNAS